MARTVLLALALVIAAPKPASAWGDEGHEIIALIADALLAPTTRRQVHALLARDDDPLTEHDIAAEATWADHLRSANPNGARNRTRRWHFVDIERAAPALDEACFGRPALPPGILASEGPARDCVVDKIDQFAAELARRDTPPDERLLALKFLLHFVGDVHQPLHAADDHDRGGNDKRVSALSIPAGTLHHYWDTEFVATLGPGPRAIAADLRRQLTPGNRQLWSRGTPTIWAMESFHLAVSDAYGRLPQPTENGIYQLDESYIEIARRDCRLQLTKAGIRLAAILDHALSHSTDHAEHRPARRGGPG